MDITLNHSEIVEALTNHIGTLGIDISERSVEVALTAGRTGNGHSATITIKAAALEEPALATTPTTPKKTRKSSPKKVLKALSLDALDPNAADVDADTTPFDVDPVKAANVAKPEEKAAAIVQEAAAPAPVEEAAPAVVGSTTPEVAPTNATSLFGK